ENNGFAISVPWSKQGHTKDVADRALGYGMPGVIVDGLDPVASYHAMTEAVARARRGEGPTLIEAKVARLTPHSSDDDDRPYKTREAVAEEKAKDCVLRFRRVLEERGVLSRGDAEEVRAACMREVDRAQEEAENSPLPSPESLHLHVYGDR
ncbi:MAG TPA: thiamine pyrophosphate-dependent enzyme, partial [Candidatus Dormibacteraeota bacterium]|nr:thiamine pyrophosphate-dependent enzyme [Candidatus Dormibacteraeota bacterium]